MGTIFACDERKKERDCEKGGHFFARLRGMIGTNVARRMQSFFPPVASSVAEPQPSLKKGEERR